MSSLSFQHHSVDIQHNLTRRHRVGRWWKGVFFASTLIAIIALAVLLLSILDKTMGLVVIENKVDPTSLASQPLDELSKEELITILEANLSRNRYRTINREKSVEQRSLEEIYQLVLSEVVKPKVLMSYPLSQSWLNRDEIEAEKAERWPNARLEFYSWLKPAFITNSQSASPELAGIRTALLGSLFLIAITVLFAFPIGVGAAIYLEEYARRKSWINRVIQVNIDNLAGVPSIVYGILGLAIFVRTLGNLTSGAAFGYPGDNGRTILSAGLTMGLLILPLLIINAQEAIRSVPGSLRQASYGLGATQWQTIWHHVLPAALPGILTGAILAVSRAIGETAPLIVVGAATYITSDPTGPFSKFTALPIQIYNWTSQPQEAFRNIAAAAIIVLMIALLSLNSIAILLRNRFSQRI
jgi:phosphate transport system permease protein